MKKKIVNALLPVAVIAAMMVSVTACGSKEDSMQEANADMMESATIQQETSEPVESTDIDEQDIDEQDADETDIQDDSTEEELEDEDDDADSTDSESTIEDEEDETDIDYIYVDGQDAIGDAPGEQKAKKEEEQKAAGKETMTLEKWIKSDECAQFSEMMNDGLDGMAISFEVNGDTLSMIFTMTETIEVAENAEAAMNEYFTSNAVIFEAIRDQLKSDIRNENIVLRLIYRNADGSDIFSMDF